MSILMILVYRKIVWCDVVFFFFFSSRRRHTRYWRDWSSDVCSSDLEGPAYCGEVARRTGAKVVKARRVRSRGDVVALEPFHVDFHLLDGGGGETFEIGRASCRERV